ncbi:MAG TPA: biotin/lipoyl-containing protein [Polyangiaceae bacterium]|nr:biotin/lipoyl-containing protein [Polyangiaceae bacterium]
MRYFVALGEHEIPVDVTQHPAGGYSVRIDGKEIAVDSVAAGDCISVRVDGRVIDLLLDGPLPDVRFVASGVRGEATIETERARASRSLSRGATAEGAGFVMAPMPGRIVRVMVAPGDSVEIGAPLIVIEAMKMENELHALHAARVGAVLVKPGDTVEGGAKLISFE